MKTLADLFKEKKRQQALKKQEDHIKYIEERLYSIAIAAISLYKDKDKRNTTGGTLRDLDKNNIVFNFISYVSDSNNGYSHIRYDSLDNIYKIINEKAKTKKKPKQSTAKERYISFSRNHIYDETIREFIEFHYAGYTFSSRLKNASLYGNINQMSVSMQVFTPKNKLFYYFNYD